MTNDACDNTAAAQAIAGQGAAQGAGTPVDDAADPQREALVVEHMTLVSHIVRETMTRVPAHVSRDDLQSAGLTALVKAARAYEPDRGVPFTRYAASRIRGAILDELRQVDWASRSVRRQQGGEAAVASPGPRPRGGPDRAGQHPGPRTREPRGRRLAGALDRRGGVQRR